MRAQDRRSPRARGYGSARDGRTPRASAGRALQSSGRSIAGSARHRSPVDHARGRALLINEHVPAVQVAVGYRRRCAQRKVGCGTEPGVERARPAPESELLHLAQTLQGEGDTALHVAPAHWVGPELVGRVEPSGDFVAVQNPQEGRQGSCQPVPGRIGQGAVGGLTPLNERAAEERPGILVGGVTQEDRGRDRQRKQRRQAMQDSHLALHAGTCDRSPRKAEHPPLVHQPDRVVPTLRQQPELSRIRFHGDRIKWIPLPPLHEERKQPDRAGQRDNQKRHQAVAVALTSRHAGRVQGRERLLHAKAAPRPERAATIPSLLLEPGGPASGHCSSC